MSDVKVRQPNLAKVLLTDWFTHIWMLLLIGAVLVSAYAVIYYAWGNRQLNAEVQQLLEDKDKLDIDWRHMLLEHNALSEHSRIEQIAREKLDMIRPQGQQEKVIKQP